MRNNFFGGQIITALFIGTFILCGVLSLVFYINNRNQCSKKFCPKDMKPALVRDAGCICLIEAK